MVSNLDFEEELKSLLPETYALLNSSGFTIHKSVTDVVLHGSRGLAGGSRLDSDIDLSLVVDLGMTPRPGLEGPLETIARVTMDQWRSEVELDLAVVFDIRDCKLKCFYIKDWDETLCAQGGENCFGLYKIKKGFRGFVNNADIQVRKIYPCLIIYHRK